ncbi:MAG: hypothetical protein WKF70_05335 [Chitinophagaceae bacterium]
MKSLRNGCFSLLLTLCLCNCFAQSPAPVTEPDYNKPKLFASLPQSVNIKVELLSNLFSVQEGNAVSINLGVHVYSGIVVSRSDVADKETQSVVVRSTNYAGSALTFTRGFTREGEVFFRGRILSRAHSDAFELQIQNNEYYFIKKHQLRIMNE